VLLAAAAAVFTLSKLALGRSPLGTAPRPPGRATSRRLGGWRSAACAGMFAGVFLLAAIPHLGVLFLSLAGRWYGTVVPDQFTLRHYIEALGNGRFRASGLLLHMPGRWQLSFTVGDATLRAALTVD